MRRRCTVVRWTALLLALFATGAARLSAQRPASTPLVGVLSFTNSVVGDEHAALDPLSAGIPELLLIELARNPAVRIVEPELLRRVLMSRRFDSQNRFDDEAASHIGQILGAHFVIRGSFTSDGRGAIRIVASEIDVASARVAHTSTVEGRQANVAALIGQLAERIERDLHVAELPNEQRRARESAQRASLETTIRFSRAIQVRDAGRKQDAIAMLQQLAIDAPDYEAARTELARLRQDHAR